MASGLISFFISARRSRLTGLRTQVKLQSTNFSHVAKVALEDKSWYTKYYISYVFILTHTVTFLNEQDRK
jgi:hypothetical protein